MLKDTPAAARDCAALHIFFKRTLAAGCRSCSRAPLSAAAVDALRLCWHSLQHRATFPLGSVLRAQSCGCNECSNAEQPVVIRAFTVLGARCTAAEGAQLTCWVEYTAHALSQTPGWVEGCWTPRRGPGAPWCTRSLHQLLSKIQPQQKQRSCSCCGGSQVSMLRLCLHRSSEAQAGEQKTGSAQAAKTFQVSTFCTCTCVRAKHAATTLASKGISAYLDHCHDSCRSTHAEASETSAQHIAGKQYSLQQVPAQAIDRHPAASRVHLP